MKDSKPSSVSTMLTAEATLQALQAADMTQDLQNAVNQDSSIARVMVEAGLRALHQKERQKAFAELTPRTRNTLEYYGVRTLKDLALTSMARLEDMKNLGAKALTDINEFASRHGITLHAHDDVDWIELALELYEKPERIPAKHMTLWVPRLDSVTRRMINGEKVDFLTDRHLETPHEPTLGALAALTEEEFIESYLRASESTPLDCSSDCNLTKVGWGLSVVGLAFATE
jgi:hypothetical protein